ncbi:MAG: glutamate racemase [Ardenticatenaceae bacterium]|nr:glutamate racemase [Ardenticatenaceae bacterium]
MNDPIAIFDSGVGGLSVLRHISTLLPHENILYLADQAHVPYGPRSAAQIQEFAQTIVQFLLGQRAKIIVVACNTASAAALMHLRQAFPQMPIVGMEPAVKPAAAQTKNGKVGVLATAVTFQSYRYADLMTRFAQNITVYEDPCAGLVDLIEAGHIHAPQTRQLLRPILAPMLAANIDTLVLGCTHYPFVQPLLAEMVGTAVTIIDPAPAVARQTARILQQHHLLATPVPSRQIRLLTTGDKTALQQFASQVLTGEFVVETAVWQTNYSITQLPNYPHPV